MTGKTVLSRLPRAEGGVRERLPALAEGLVRCALSFALSMASVSGGYSPFAVGFVAASPPGAMSLASLAGAALGYFIFGTFETSLKYSAMCVLAAAAVFALRGSAIYARAWFRPLAAGVMAACTGFVYVYDAGWSMPAIAAFICETVVIAACARIYHTALSPWRGGFDRAAETMRCACVLLALSTLTASLSALTVFGVLSVGRALSALCVLALAFAGGVPGGAVCAFVLGLMTDISCGTLFFTVSFTLGGVTAALFRRRGRLAFVLAYIICAAATAVCLWENLRTPAVFYETFAASVLFLLLPPAAATRLSGFFPSQTSGYGAMLARECARVRAVETAEAFKVLADVVRVRAGDGKNDDSAAVVFDMAAERVCRRCKRSAECWQAGCQTTLDVFNGLTARLRETGSVSAKDFPDFFAERCGSLPQLASAITEEARAQTVRRQYRSRALESRGAAAGQYSDMADILSSIAGDLGGSASFEPELERKLVKYLRSLDIEASAAVFRMSGGRLRAELSGTEIRALKRDGKYLDKLSAVAGVRLCTTEEGISNGRLTLLEAEPLSVAVGTSSIKRAGEKKSGDRHAFFKTDDGRLCVLLSDGMGTGTAAAECSAAASGILERLLRAGSPPETALHLLNELMLLKNGDAPDNATVDLLCLDLFSGTADMYKLGAAPSYAVSGKAVKRLAQRDISAPLGTFSDAEPERIRVKLSPGTAIAMVSDGVTRGLDDGWLCETLASSGGCGAKELAKKISDGAVEKFGADDDMTVLTVLVSERK